MAFLLFIYPYLLTLFGRIFLDELFGLVLLNHVRQLFPSFLHSCILKMPKLKKEVDLVVPHLKIVPNLITHGGATVHCPICPVVVLMHHPMTDHYPVSRKVLKTGALNVSLEVPNQISHLSNVKVLVLLLKLRSVRPIKKRFGPLVANSSPPTD